VSKAVTKALGEDAFAACDPMPSSSKPGPCRVQGVGFEGLAVAACDPMPSSSKPGPWCLNPKP